MTEEEYLDVKSMIEDFPVVFNNNRPWCGMSCGKGWEPLLRDLCSRLTEILVEPGLVVMAQVKEKFGGLRFYIDWNYEVPKDTDKWESVLEVVEEAERKSTSICERCGQPGEPRATGWIKTLCEKHFTERN